MNNILKTTAAIGFAGAMALASASPSMARDWRHHNHGWHNGAAAAGGFVAGTVLGAAAATAGGGYYGDDYAYSPGYDSYAYQPGYRAYGSAGYQEPEGYGAVEGRSSFDTNNIGPNRERNVRATW